MSCDTVMPSHSLSLSNFRINSLQGLLVTRDYHRMGLPIPRITSTFLLFSLPFFYLFLINHFFLLFSAFISPKCQPTRSVLQCCRFATTLKSANATYYRRLAIYANVFYHLPRAYYPNVFSFLLCLSGAQHEAKFKEFDQHFANSFLFGKDNIKQNSNRFALTHALRKRRRFVPSGTAIYIYQII